MHGKLTWTHLLYSTLKTSVTKKCPLFGIGGNFKEMDPFQGGTKENYLKYLSAYLWSSDWLHLLWKMKEPSENGRPCVWHERLGFRYNLPVSGRSYREPWTCLCPSLTLSFSSCGVRVIPSEPTSLRIRGILTCIIPTNTCYVCLMIWTASPSSLGVEGA